MDNPATATPTAARDVGFALLSSTVIPVTRELVQEYIGMERSPTERDVSRTRVKHLREKIDAGLAVTFHWVRAKCLWDGGKLIRVNGQHSSTMLSELDGMMPTGLQVLQETYECKTGDALALLHQQFDDRKSARSTDDIAGVYQGLQPELSSVDKKLAKLAIDGYTWFQRSVEGVPTRVGDAAYSLFGDSHLHPFVKWIGEVNTTKTRELQNRPTAAAMYATFASDETGAREYWDLVSRGGDLDEVDLPQTVLAKWLLGLYEGTVDPDDFKTANVFQGCAYAWNAHKDGKRIQDIRWSIKKNITPVR